MISVFDIFKIGIGPSSSHTVGPMRAACSFVQSLQQQGDIVDVFRIQTELFGSLAATGKGHGTDKAVLLGLMGETPENIDPDTIDDKQKAIDEDAKIRLLNQYPIAFNKQTDIIFRRKALPFHANGMRFLALDEQLNTVLEKEFYSVGGGFIVSENEISHSPQATQETIPYPFHSAKQLLEYCRQNQCAISDIILTNELTVCSEQQIKQDVLNLWSVMRQCVQRGLTQQGILPGGMKVKRRAAKLHQQLNDPEERDKLNVPMGTLDWVNLYALAVSEENAAGGRVVTAPTNGAAGIIPAVLHYYDQFCSNTSEDGIIRFMLTAAAIGILYKENASISGAEVGCQGEVGVACSMAAGALAEVLGGTPEQVENAAEIGMEHNLGLTCDPVGGLVQVPCIERNAMGAVKAINAARIALRGDGSHFVSLDQVIKTMRDTGADMKTKYKETSRGGLAVNIIEC